MQLITGMPLLTFQKSALLLTSAPLLHLHSNLNMFPPANRKQIESSAYIYTKGEATVSSSFFGLYFSLHKTVNALVQRTLRIKKISPFLQLL